MSSKNGNNVVDSKSLAADAAMEGKRQQTLSEPKSTKRIQITHKVPIKNSFHLVEIAPRCEKTNNRGMVMEALQSLHQYNKLGSKAKLLSEFSLRFRSSHNLFTFISNVK